MGKTKIKKTVIAIDSKLPDVQKRKENSGISLDKVGVKGVEWPMYIRRFKGETQGTIGLWNLYVELPAGTKGTHMSRFVEILGRYERQDITLELMDKFMKPELREVMEATKAHIEVSFKYMVAVSSPGSQRRSWLPLECRFIVSDYHGPVLSVKVPVHTCCPCSKEISATGNTHNQRSFVTIDAVMKDFVWIEHLATIAIKSASAPIVPLLKRIDEAIIVDTAYNKPKFVEDVARDVKRKLKEGQEEGRLGWFRIRVENEESIHVHNAFAEVYSDDVPGEVRGMPFGIALKQGNGKGRTTDLTEDEKRRIVMSPGKKDEPL